MIRRLAVLKLWQVQDPFDPESFFLKIRSGIYDWEDIRRLVKTSERIDPDDIIASVEKRFATLRQLSKLEQQLMADTKSGRNTALAEQIRAKIRTRLSPI